MSAAGNASTGLHALSPSHVIQVVEDERLVKPEAAGNDVLCILKGKPPNVLERESRSEEELLVVGKLYDEWYVEYVLEPCELAQHSREHSAFVNVPRIYPHLVKRKGIK